MQEFAVLLGDSPHETAEQIQSILSRHCIVVDNASLSSLENGIHLLTVRLAPQESTAYEHAVSLLREESFQVYTEGCILVSILDEPGAIAKIAVPLRSESITVHSLQITPAATCEGSTSDGMRNMPSLCAVVTAPEHRDRACSILEQQSIPVVGAICKGKSY